MAIYVDGVGGDEQPINEEIVKEYIDSEIQGLINGAPAVLDTLKELSDAINNDPNFMATIQAALQAKLNLSGGIMTGPITLPSNPTLPLQAATKQYVDSSIANLPDPVLTLDGLTDVYVSDATTGQLLAFNGTYWYPTTVNVPDAVTINNAAVNGSGRLIITLTNGSTIDAGYVVGPQGIQGPKGDAGAAGVSISSATVDATGHLILTLSNGSIIDAGSSVGPQGPKGDPGPGGALGNWGSFWDTTDQAAGAINTPYIIKIGKTDPNSSGVTVTDGSKITFESEGVYNIQYSLQFTNTNTGNSLDNANVWLSVNGQTLPDTNSIYSIPHQAGSSPGSLIASINYLVKVNAGDYAQLNWSTNNTLITINTVPGSGAVPESPGVIATAQQVMYTQVGPQGPQGEQGIPGPQGEQGIPGPAGTSYTLNGVADEVKVYGLSSTTQPGYNLEVDLANRANKLTTARNIALTGKVTGLATFDGSANVTMLTSLSGVTTNDVAEGINKYFTDARARAALTGSAGISYNSGTGVISLNANTDQVAEGANNLYFTNNRFDNRLAQSNLMALADVANVTPTAGQALVWNGNTWAPGTVSGGGGTGTSSVYKATAKVEYDASGNLSSVSILDGNISAVIATATSTTATVTFTFTGAASTPLGIQVYGYQRTNNVYVTRALASDFPTRTLLGGGTSGSPTAFETFDPSSNTLTLGLTKAATGASAAVGQTTHCIVQFILSSV